MSGMAYITGQSDPNIPMRYPGTLPQYVSEGYITKSTEERTFFLHQVGCGIVYLSAGVPSRRVSLEPWECDVYSVSEASRRACVDG